MSDVCFYFVHRGNLEELHFKAKLWLLCNLLRVSVVIHHSLCEYNAFVL